MSNSAPIGLPEAARQLGVSLRTLRQVMRSGHVPSPPQHTATATLPDGWMEAASAALAAVPLADRRTLQQKVKPFARYEGTSAWRKYPRRVREYARYRAAKAKNGLEV